jgi:PKD repeat protein
MHKHFLRIALTIIGITLFLIGTSAKMSQVLAENPLNLTVKTNKSSYILRNQVEISGNLTYDSQPVQGGLVGIEARDPHTTPQKIVTRTLQVGAISPPPGGWPIEIQSATLCTFEGTPITSTLRGTDAYFKATVKYNGAGSRQIRVTVNIYDNSLIPLGILSSQFTISKGDIVTVGPANIYIESWTTPGIAPIYANVYTGWPDTGGYPLCPEKRGNFTLLESEYESPPGNPLPSPFIENGKYKMYFTLPPDPLPGTYIVNASAWYQGWTNMADTTFSVTDVVAPPRASFVAKPPVAGPGYNIAFDGSYSSAEGYGDTINSYSWKFGDTKTGTGISTTHAYAAIGNYTVTLNVTDGEGFWNTTSKIIRIATIHDVAVVTIQSLDQVYDNWIVKVSVTVKNIGTIPETFNVNLAVNDSFAQTKQVSNLGPSLTWVLEFSWNTTGITRYSNYFLKATIPPIVNETHTSDNTLTKGPIYTMALGDSNKNRQIDIFDLVTITGIYGKTPSSPKWNIMADLNPDGKIDIFDVVKATSVYGRKY